MTESLTEGAVAELALTGMAHGGEAVGRTEDGRVVFAAGGVAGETVAVRVSEVHDRFARGAVVGVRGTPSPDRLPAARCPYFGATEARGTDPAAWCGACQWQHVDYGAQLRFKTSILRDALQRIGKIEGPPVLDTIGMTEPWGYRNHLRLVAGAAGAGYRAVDGAHVVPVEECPIAHPLVAELIPTVSDGLPQGTEVALRAGTRTGDRMIVLFVEPESIGEIESDTDASVAVVPARGESVTVAGSPFLTEELGGRRFLIPPAGFFQVNTEMAEHLVAEVRRAVGARVRVLVDVHSGVGVFAALCADLAEEVFAIERDSASVAAAVENAAGLDHLSLVEGTAEEGLEYLDRPLDVVVVDPPRTGLDPSAMRLLAERRPLTIVYVSCEPSTLARDARQLLAAGWRLESCQPVDMFPQTFHVESVNVFRR